MAHASVQLAQFVIPDDPELRRVALVNVVLEYCSHILFPATQNISEHASKEEEIHSYSRVTNGNGYHCSEELKPEELVVDRLSGGITNELFRVFHPSKSEHSVVVRVFGKETERVIARESELFYQSIFVPTYVRGTNFLIYEFLNLHKALPFTEMPVESNKIASEIASFQVRATLESRSDHHRPILTEEERIYWEAVSPTLGSGGKKKFDICRFDREENYTMHALTKWVEQITSEGIMNKLSAEKKKEYDIVASRLQYEAPWMLQLLQNYSNELGESVCHNDLLSANIMRHTENGGLRIIDFDYVKRNFLLFDIANHFNEYTGLDCDYHRYFPSDMDMEKFITIYRESIRRELQKHYVDAQSRKLDDIIPGQEELFGLKSNENVMEQKAVVRWVQLVKLLTLASHLCWSIWALLQEAVSALDMDFLEYAKLRLARYLETKEAFSAGFT